jgi:hypothetical protein
MAVWLRAALTAGQVKLVAHPFEKFGRPDGEVPAQHMTYHALVS